MRVLFISAGLLCASHLLAILWWHLWMDHGFPGATGGLASWFALDGEAAYDARFLEMWGWIMLFAVVILGWVNGKRRLTGR